MKTILKTENITKIFHSPVEFKALKNITFEVQQGEFLSIIGKKLIKNLVDFAKNHNIEDRFVFIEDYDINVAKYIVQGVDVWLNTPIRPFEASGTSGMKAGLNGVLNLSVLDGWWPECYDGENGWAITAGESILSQDVNNYLEAQQIYDLLEGEITDLYYRRDESNLPYGWLQKMKHSIYTVGKGFNLNRMLQEYINDYYLPAINATNELTADKNKLLKEMIKTEQELNKQWNKVSIKDTYIKIKDVPLTSSITVNSGDIVSVDCYVNMGNATQNLFGVEVLYQEDDAKAIKTIPLEFEEKYQDNVARYSGEFELSSSGLQSINIRIRGLVSSYYQNSYNFIKE
jgi:starch phosphorylase